MAHNLSRDFEHQQLLECANINLPSESEADDYEPPSVLPSTHLLDLNFHRNDVEVGLVDSRSPALIRDERRQQLAMANNDLLNKNRESSNADKTRSKALIPINSCPNDHIRYARGFGQKRADALIKLRTCLHSHRSGVKAYHRL